MIAFVLFQTGAGPEQPGLKRALAWLSANQDTADGSWPAHSLNKHRDPSSEIGRFMRDAATAYAVAASGRVRADWRGGRGASNISYRLLQRRVRPQEEESHKESEEPREHEGVGADPSRMSQHLGHRAIRVLQATDGQEQRRKKKE